MIPILDLKEQYQALKGEIDAAAGDVLANGHFITGPNVAPLENEIPDYTGVGHAAALHSGTHALYLALRALDIGPGDEVITTPFTFVATTEAIGLVGAKPIFVDIDPVTFNSDPAYIEKAITPRTRAIIPVHLYGVAARMSEIMNIARRRKLRVIEDCAQAIGAIADGVRVGAIGDIGCFSFFPSKNLGAYGDGGMITTNSPALADRVRSLRAHGGRVKYHHDELGMNSRLDELQAAILRVKLRHLDAWNAARRQVARRYTDALKNMPSIIAPRETSENHVYHQYTIRTPARDALKQRLAEIKDRYPTLIAEVRGEGLLIGLRALVPAGTLVDALRAEKMISVPTGDNVVRLLPPRIVSEQEIDGGIARLDRACARLSRHRP